MTDDKAENTVISVLRQIPVPAATEGFSSRVIDKAIKGQSSSRKLFMPIIASGIAASLFTWFVITTFIFNAGEVSETPQLFLVENEVKTIKLAIESEATVNDVKMTIELSENLKLIGYDNLQLLNWSTSLKQGVNIISLPVSAIALGDGLITTTVRSNGKERVFVIQTKYELPDQAKLHIRSGSQV